MERVTGNIYIAICKTASGNFLYNTGSSHPVLCDNLEGWDGVGGGREISERGDICKPMTDSG